MFVTVIITCYNLERYIAEAIDSVLCQGFDPLLYEIVVVDDCSTDRSPEIIKSYRDVRYLRPDRNLGVLRATVFGLESSISELVFFLDGDDVWESSKLSTVVGRFGWRVDIARQRLVFGLCSPVPHACFHPSCLL